MHIHYIDVAVSSLHTFSTLIAIYVWMQGDGYIFVFEQLVIYHLPDDAMTTGFLRMAKFTGQTIMAKFNVERYWFICGQPIRIKSCKVKLKTWKTCTNAL